jgi:ankyrin repeat protein
MRGRRLDTIHVATVKGRMETVIFLLANGVPIDSENQYGETPLHKAVIWQKNLIVDKLLALKASVNKVDHRGVTPLLQACRKTQFPVAQKLIEHKAYVNHQSLNGKTALKEAITCKNLNLVELLLVHDVEIQDPPQLFQFLKNYDNQEWGEHIENFPKVFSAMQKLSEKISRLPEEKRSVELELNVKTYLVRLKQIADLPEVVWESFNAFPLQNGRVPLDVTNMCLEYLGFFKAKKRMPVTAGGHDTSLQLSSRT